MFWLIMILDSYKKKREWLIIITFVLVPKPYYIHAKKKYLFKNSFSNIVSVVFMLRALYVLNYLQMLEGNQRPTFLLVYFWRGESKKEYLKVSPCHFDYVPYSKVVKQLNIGY